MTSNVYIAITWFQGCSYLGGDQGRETSAGDVAHLVWAEIGKKLVAKDEATLNDDFNGEKNVDLR